MTMTSKEYINRYFYYIVPLLAFLLQLLMSLNSFNQLRFEELIESVQAPFWLDNRLIISGLHVNVGWYALLAAVYNIFGFSLHSGKIIYLVMTLFSNFALFYLLRRFFTVLIASIILLTIVLSPTYLYMNVLNLHWALTFHILIAILVLLYLLDFAKKKLSLVMTGAIFFLMMWGWLSYQAFVFYIPSLIIFYWLKYRLHPWGVKAHPRGVKLAIVAAIAFLLPLLMLFIYVDNRHILIADNEAGRGLFRGGGRFEISQEVFAAAWTDFISDFFITGVSHHYEVKLAEFSLLFPVITLIFMAIVLYKLVSIDTKMKKFILLALLVIGFDTAVFSTTSDLGMPGMKRVTPMLFSIYFLWVVVWWGVEKRKIIRPSFGGRGIGGIWGMRVVLGLLMVHHLIVYPVNLAAIREPSPFRVDDWFDTNDPQMSVSKYVESAQQRDLELDCRQFVAKGMGCFYDFIYPAVAGSCEWNNLGCHKILGYDLRTNQFIPLSIDLWQRKYWEE